MPKNFYNQTFQTDIPNTLMTDAAPSTPPRTPIKTISSESINPISPQSPSFFLKVMPMTDDSETFVNFELDENNEPIFYITSNRPNTRYGRRQAEHATPYTCLIEMIYNALQGEEIYSAITKVVEIVNIFLPDKEMTFGDIVQNHDAKITELTVAREARKSATQLTRAGHHIASELKHMSPKLTEELKSHQSEQFPEFTSAEVIDRNIGIIEAGYLNDIGNKIKKAMRNSETTTLCNLAKEIANKTLIELNKDDFVAFLATDGSDKDSKEGSRVRNARCGLYSLNQLINLLPKASTTIEQISDQEPEKIHDLTFAERSRFKTGLKVLLGLLPVANEEIKAKGNKFDKEIKELENKDTKELLKFIREKLDEIDIQKVASQLVIDLFDFKHDSKSAIADVPHVLSIICIRHLAIMSICFPKISANTELKAELERNFLNLGVLQQSGWNNLEVAVQTKSKKRPVQSAKLDFRSLVQKIKLLSEDEKYSKMAKRLSLTELSETPSETIASQKRLKPEKQGVEKPLDSTKIANHNHDRPRRPSTSAIPIGSMNSGNYNSK